MLRRISDRNGKALTFLWMSVIFVLSSVPSVPGDGAGIPFFHQIGHFAEFFVLAVLLALFIFKNEKVKTILAAASFAVLMETYQYFLPWRAFETIDLALDLLGVVSASTVREIVLNKANLINY